MIIKAAEKDTEKICTLNSGKKQPVDHRNRRRVMQQRRRRFNIRKTLVSQSWQALLFLTAKVYVCTAQTTLSSL